MSKLTLIIEKFAQNVKSKQYLGLYRCECGNEKEILNHHVLLKQTRSCGCLRIKAATTHGFKGTRTYKSWESMKQRTSNSNSWNFCYYGGRGITICERWQNFEAFLEDMGERPEGKTLDRIDVNGNYEPGNCRWATAKEQNNNQTPKKKI